jgi:hypothetical protein
MPAGGRSAAFSIFVDVVRSFSIFVDVLAVRSFGK